MKPCNIGKTMTSHDKKTTDHANKNKPAAKNVDASGQGPSKADSGETASAAPANYSRGEGQKPVTRAYKENWNAIFAKKNTNKKRR